MKEKFFILKKIFSVKTGVTSVGCVRDLTALYLEELAKQDIRRY